MSDRAELKRTILRLQRALTHRSQLRVLLAASDATIAERRADIRHLRTRIERSVEGTRQSMTGKPRKKTKPLLRQLPEALDD